MWSKMCCVEKCKGICHVEQCFHMTDFFAWAFFSLICPNKSCFVAKFVLSKFTLICREIGCIAVNALLCGEKLNQKLRLWRKKDKYHVCWGVVYTLLLSEKEGHGGRGVSLVLKFLQSAIQVWSISWLCQERKKREIDFVLKFSQSWITSYVEQSLILQLPSPTLMRPSITLASNAPTFRKKKIKSYYFLALFFHKIQVTLSWSE